MPEISIKEGIHKRELRGRGLSLQNEYKNKIQKN